MRVISTTICCCNNFITNVQIAVFLTMTKNLLQYIKYKNFKIKEI